MFSTFKWSKNVANLSFNWSSEKKSVCLVKHLDLIIYLKDIWVNSISRKPNFKKWKLLCWNIIIKLSRYVFKSQPIQNFTTQLTLIRSPAHYESCGAIQSITCVLQVDLISRSKELSWFLGIAKFNFALNRKRGIIVPAVPTYPHWF